MRRMKHIIPLSLTLMTLLFSACNKEDEYFDAKYQSVPITVKQIYLEDYESSVPDRPVTFARLGQMIRIEGSGLFGMKKVFINGYETYFNRAYVTDNSMLISLNLNTPVADAEPEDRDIIRLVKEGASLDYEFTIRASSPTVSRISNTLPQAGELVTVYGTGLHETSKVLLPGGTVITDGIVSDEEGKWYSFTMPSGVSVGGSLLSEGANGQASSPGYFNYADCIVLDFDGRGNQGFWDWTPTGSMIDDTDLSEDPTQSGRGLCVQIVPQRLLDAGGIQPGKPRAAECWTAGEGNDGDWSWMFSYIPANTPLTDVALQFDVLVPGTWTATGQIQVSLFNNFNFGGIGSDDDGPNNQVAFYVPYIVDGAMEPFSAPAWQTVTIPFSQFNKYATAISNKETVTFQNVVDDRNAATYKNFGIGFANTDFTLEGVEVKATTFATDVYLDNWRIVPCKSVVISDYPEDDEEVAD